MEGVACLHKRAMQHLRGGSQVSKTRPPNFLCAALDRTACAPFYTERRIECAEPPNFAGNRGPGAPVFRPRMLANSGCVWLVVTLYTRSFVENVRIAGCDFFMQRDKFWVEVARRPGLVRKGTEVVHSSHQGSAIVSFQLPHIGRDIADGEADSSLRRSIRRGSMNNAHVVQGHLSWLQLQRYRLGLIHLYSYSWPRDRALFFAKVSLCGIWSSVCVPGMTSIAPFDFSLSESATHAVTTSGLDNPQ